MIENALKGNRSYWIWMTLLLLFIVSGISTYFEQLRLGLSVTALSGALPWGLSTMQFTVMASVAASTLLVVMPHYLHDYKPFGNIALIAQFLGASASAIALLSLFIDMGKPQLILDLLRYATPYSPYSWVVFLLTGYFFINLVTGWATLAAERKGVPAPAWITPLIYLSIPWAIALPVVTGFVYPSFSANHWVVSLFALRTLASAYAGGTALLLLIILIMKRAAGFDPGKGVTDTIVMLVICATSFTIVLVGVECFASLCGKGPLLQYKNLTVSLTWLSLLLAVASMTVFLVPAWKSSFRLLLAATVGVVLSIFAEKGAALLNLTKGGVVAYSPATTELSMVFGVLALGLLFLTILLKAVLAVKRAG